MSLIMNTAAARGFAKARRRLLPFVILVYITSYLDRVNVSFAAPALSEDLGFTPEFYGFAAGVFFLSYAALEVPSNIFGQRTGVRRWLARIMITWGVLAVLTGFVQNETQFVIARFLLGAAEAGAFPMLTLYLVGWTPREARGRTLGLFIASVAIAGAVGGPISGFLLGLDGMLGLQGWQWIFIVEGIPALILGLIVLAWLPNRPEEAGFLDAEEKSAMRSVLDEDAADAAQHRLSVSMLRDALHSRPLWGLSIANLFIILTTYAIVLWLPSFTAVSFPDLSELQRGFLNGLPFLCAALSMWLVGRSSDRTGDRLWHLVIPLFIASAAMLAAAVLGLMNGYLALVIATVALYGGGTLIWSVVSGFVVGSAAAGGFALVNSVAAVGGFIGPFVVGFLVGRGGIPPALDFIAGVLLVAAVTCLLIVRPLLRR
jgi:ACS family tartrate transporter-like MFS transporter